MPSSSFRDCVTRALHEAREHSESHDVGILLEVLRLLDEGRFDELPDLIARLRPIFRARVGAPPTLPEVGEGGGERPGQSPGVA
jgi:hypothetical protein